MFSCMRFATDLLDELRPITSETWGIKLIAVHAATQRPQGIKGKEMVCIFRALEGLFSTSHNAASF